MSATQPLGKKTIFRGGLKAFYLEKSVILMLLEIDRTVFKSLFKRNPMVFEDRAGSGLVCGSEEFSA